jgi:hypothetical protein
VKSVCLTLYEGDYMWGVGALANSLYRSGFRGSVVVGYCGERPNWVHPAEWGSGEWHVDGDFRVVLMELPQGIGIHQLKPYAMVRVLDEIEPDADRLYLFDADIIVVARWQYFEALVEEGAALVSDYVFPRIAMTHPWRRAWTRLCTDAGFSVRPGEDYYIGAFCGISRQHRALVDAWWRLTQELHKQRPELAGRFRPGDRMVEPFNGTDQDLLAAAVMATKVPICRLGPEALGFTGSPDTMLHPTGEKPWRGSALGRLLARGSKPDLYTRNFWRYLDSPIIVHRRLDRWLRRLDVGAASALARFFGGA